MSVEFRVSLASGPEPRQPVSAGDDIARNTTGPPRFRDAHVQVGAGVAAVVTAGNSPSPVRQARRSTPDTASRRIHARPHSRPRNQKFVTPRCDRHDHDRNAAPRLHPQSDRSDPPRAGSARSMFVRGTFPRSDRSGRVVAGWQARGFLFLMDVIRPAVSRAGAVP